MELEIDGKFEQNPQIQQNELPQMPDNQNMMQGEN